MQKPYCGNPWLQKTSFFVATNHKCESKAVAAFEDAILFEGIGATAGRPYAPMAMINIDKNTVAGGEVSGMHGGKYIGASKATRRKLESIIADDFEAAATIVVKGDATDIGAQAVLLGHNVGHIKLIDVVAIAANQR